MELHIGEEIKRVLKEKGKKSKWLAEQIHTSPRNLYDLLTRDEISTSQLAEISRELEYDFFALYQRDFPNFNKREGSEDIADRKTVSVLVPLNGGEESLNEWFAKLRKLNEALS